MTVPWKSGKGSEGGIIAVGIMFRVDSVLSGLAYSQRHPTHSRHATSSKRPDLTGIVGYHYSRTPM